MSLILVLILQLQHEPEAGRVSLELSSGVSVQYQDGSSGFLYDNDMIWIEWAFNQRRPIVFDQSSGEILPATVSSYIYAKDIDGERSFFAIERPGAMRIATDFTHRGQISALLEDAIANQRPIALALRDGLFIEDVVLIDDME